MDEIKNIDKIVAHWINTSDEDLDTMHKLFDAKTFHWSLFMGHISIEKLLKGLYVTKNKKHAPFTHNLVRLVELCDVEIEESYLTLLDKITTFNLNTRYDDYKREFFKQCTREFTVEWIEKIITIREWIKNQL